MSNNPLMVPVNDGFSGPAALSQASACSLHSPFDNVNVNIDLATEQLITSHEAIMSLRKWIEIEADRQKHAPSPGCTKQKKLSMLRKVTVSYGIAELLRHMMKTDQANTVHRACAVDNFTVRVLYDTSEGLANNMIGGHDGAEHIWEVVGVDMMSPQLSLKVVTPSFLGCDLFEGEGEGETLGKNIEVDILDVHLGQKQRTCFGQNDELMLCHLFGVLLHELFSPSNHNITSEWIDDAGSTMNGDIYAEPSRKKKFSDLFPPDGQSLFPSGIVTQNHNEGSGGIDKEPNLSYVAPTLELECSSSVCSLVKNLLDCGRGDFRPDDSYPSLESASEDLHLLLLDPENFLFVQCEGFHQPDQQANGRMPLQLRKDKVYGREAESSLITDAFCRVASSGESEALFIGGFSGCGKSRLAQTSFVPVRVAGGYVVSKQFHEMSKPTPLSVILDAFNELCALVEDGNSEEDLLAIEAELIRVFGNNLSMLTRILPNINKIIRSQTGVLTTNNQVENNINFTGLCFTIQCLMRAMSQKSRPIMILLDDLQWADEMSLGVIHAVLSDIKGYSCLFFVGSYRDNEVQPDHALFRFMDKLSSFNVQSTKLHLDGLNDEDLNAMISDGLGIFPRLCKTLSSTVYYKTQGNPLLALEFIQSLVDRDLLQYSFRERRWVWDEKKIRAEEISDSVLQLLTTKMAALQPDLLEALKIASCFGTQINSYVVELLNATPQHSDFKKELGQAAHEGLVEQNNSSYRFVHDKVREAAYSLIDANEKEHYHYKMGMLLHIISKEQEVGAVLYSTVDQINCGISLVLNSTPQRILVAELNLKAGTQAMSGSNFVSAHLYLNVGVSMLLDSSWESHYVLSLSLFLSLAKAAYAIGHIDESSEALDVVIEKGKSLEDKLDAYLLSVSVLHTRQDIAKALKTCLLVLRLLGEDVPDQVEKEEIIARSQEAQSMFANISDDDLLNMPETKSVRHIEIMKFYDKLLIASFHATSREMWHYYSCRSALLNFKYGFCKYTCISFAQLACTLQSFLTRDLQGAYTVGKIALKLLSKYDVTDAIPVVYMIFYAYIAIIVEPFQSCADMLQKGYVMAMSKGDTATAALNIVHVVPKALFGGTNLSTLKKEVNCQLKLMTYRPQKLTKPYWLIFQETLAVLAGDQLSDNPNVETDLLAGQDGTQISDYSDSLFHLRLMTSYWTGRYERAKYYAERVPPGNSSMNSRGKFRIITSAFYYGLTATHFFRRKRKNVWIKKTKQSIATMEEAAEISKWNFQNKLLLLNAELFSIECKEDEAEQLYEDAIAAARDSKFIHEQGLSCELAGFHYKSIGNKDKALSFFHQAKQCYVEWGSHMKVDFINSQMQLINGT